MYNSAKNTNHFHTPLNYHISSLMLSFKFNSHFKISLLIFSEVMHIFRRYLHFYTYMYMYIIRKYVRKILFESVPLLALNNALIYTNKMLLGFAILFLLIFKLWKGEGGRKGRGAFRNMKCCVWLNAAANPFAYQDGLSAEESGKGEWDFNRFQRSLCPKTCSSLH